MTSHFLPSPLFLLLSFILLTSFLFSIKRIIFSLFPFPLFPFPPFSFLPFFSSQKAIESSYFSKSDALLLQNFYLGILSCRIFEQEKESLSTAKEKEMEIKSESGVKMNNIVKARKSVSIANNLLLNRFANVVDACCVAHKI